MQDAFSHVGAIEPSFGEAVREARLEFGWSQQRLAERLSSNGLKLDSTAITRIEKGQRSVRLSEAVTIAAELGIDLNELIARVENPAQVLAQARESANRAMNKARSALQAMVFEFHDITLMLADSPEMLEVLGRETDGAVSEVDEYLPWVAARLSAITDGDWTPLPVRSEASRRQLAEILSLVTRNLVITPEQYDAYVRAGKSEDDLWEIDLDAEANELAASDDDTVIDPDRGHA